MTTRLAHYAELYRKDGPWVLAYVDAGTGTVDTLEAGDVRGGNTRDALAGQGASKEDIKAVEEALMPADGEPSPVSRFVLVRHGNVELNELLPGRLVAPEKIEVEQLPDLLPLLKHGMEEYPYVVVEASRDGGEIRLHYAGAREAAVTEAVEGSGENLKKVPGGGRSQGKYQHRTEEIWRRNAGELASEIDRVVRDSDAKLLILAGDVRARGLVQEQLADASRTLLRTVDSHTHTGGADPGALDDQVEQLVAEQWATEQQRLVERFAEQEGQANPESATGLGAVVGALQQAQVDVLILNDRALSERRLLALGSEPWLATSEDQALGADVVGSVPATTALLRAAALTDASVLLVPNGVMPDGVELAALLRWASGPAAPAG
ncbi:Vms1/Ankzf1 family peptidyl-tRNA hydrolase [Arthrobacter sp. NyZ413]|uniref:baeRF2 domain-containing protein n=1 Tax=Arthrobacter sp. NyZ413 TaxID=3144669 RepID=UPI003BF83667